MDTLTHDMRRLVEDPQQFVGRGECHTTGVVAGELRVHELVVRVCVT
jgi:hypothetical protein